MRISLQGLGALDKQLGQLGEELGVKVLVKAARLAFAPVLEAARSRVPTDTGLLRDSLRIKVVRPRDGNGVVQVGLRIAAGKGANKASARHAAKTARAAGASVKSAVRSTWRKSASWRWHFVEFGTAHQAARPFLRPAMDSNAEQMIEKLKSELAIAIARALKRRKGSRK